MISSNFSVRLSVCKRFGGAAFLTVAFANDTSAVWVGFKKCGSQQNLFFLAQFHHKFFPSSLISFLFKVSIIFPFKRVTKSVFSHYFDKIALKTFAFFMRGDKLREKLRRQLLPNIDKSLKDVVCL